MDEQYNVRVNGDYQPYVESTGQAVTATDQLTTSLGRLAVGLGAVAQRADRRLTLFSAGEVAAVTALTVAAARYDQQTSQLQAHQVMLNKSTADYKVQLNGVRTSMGLTTTDSIALVTQLNRLNVPFSQQQAQAKEYVRLASVTGESVTGLAQSQTMFMRAVDPNQGSKNIERYSSAVAKMNAEMGAGAQSTLDFATSIAPLSKTMGMSAQDILGISGSFAKAGQDGYAAGTVYTKILSDINRATQYGSPELKVYSDLVGKTTEQFKDMGASQQITAIFDALNKEGPQAIKTLDRLGLDGVRSQRAIAAVLSQGGLQEGINTANRGFDDPERYRKASEKALSGTNDNLSKIRESMTGFGQSVGGVFLPAADSLTGGLVKALRPLNEFSDFMTKLPNQVKDVGVGLAALAVAAPLLPRILTGLAGASAIPLIARGSLGQGFLQGQNPNRAQSRAQAEFARGGGSTGYRGFYRAGMFLGDRFNFGGRNGALGDREFLGPNGERIDIQGTRERAYDNAVRLGLIDEGTAERRRKINERNGLENRSLGVRGVNRTVGFLGDLARSQLRPWNVGYQRDSAMDSVRNPETVLGNPENFKGFRGLFSKEGFENNLKQVKDHSSAFRLAAAEARTQTIQNRADFRDTHGVLRNLVREGGSLGLAGVRAGAGVGYGVASATGRLGLRAAGGLVGLAGGPAGIALGAGITAGTTFLRNRSDAKESRTDDNVDDSAGSEYRNSLGLASKATKSFAEIVLASATSMNTTVSSVQDAINVTADDIKKAAGRTDQIVDQNIKTMSASQATTYAGAILPGADPREAQALKYDLIARFGGGQAQTILNQADKTGANSTNLFGLLNDQQSILGSRFFSNNVYQTDATKRSGQMIADTAKTQLGQAATNEGSAGVGRMQQSLLNQFVADQYRYTRDTGKGSLRFDPVSQARFGAISQTLGLEADDDASRKALQNVLDNLRGQNLSGDALNAEIDRQLSQGLAGTDIGAKRAQAQQMGGRFTGLGYLSRDNPAQPFGMLGGTLDTLRTTSLGQRLTSDGATNAPGRVAFERALNNEGNADMQSQAVREGLDNSIRANKGNLDAVNAELINFKNNAGAASSQASALADAMLAAAAQEREYSNAMGGRTTLGSRMGQANTDFATAQLAYQSNPNAPGAYQRVEDTRKAAQETNVEATQRLNDLASQYRQFDIQRQQGQEQLAYSEQRAREDYYRQAGYSEADYARQRSRNAEAFNLQLRRGQADFNLQRARSESDYQRSRRRQEADFNHQLVLMANQSAKSIYDVYTRVTVQRTQSGTNLLANLEDQNKRIAEQQENLAAIRKAGLSNAAISQLGLNESGNAQQLARLLQDLQEDPDLVRQYNAQIKKRQKGAGDLMKDPANEQYQEMVRQQKLATKRADEDFARSMERQQRDFRKQISRMRADYATQMGQAAEDFIIMRDRQRRQMEIGFANQRKDFARQMRISEQNISTYAEDISLSFEQAYKITHSRTRGETRKQIENMANLLDQYQGLVVGKNNDVKAAVKNIYSEFGGTFYKKLSEKEVVKAAGANLGYDLGGYHDGGATPDVGEYRAAGVVHGGEHVATKKEVDSTPGGHKTWTSIRRAVREGDTEFLQHLPGYAAGGQVKDPDKRVSVDGKALSNIAARQLALAEQAFRVNLSVMQGGFGGSHIAASGTSHNWPGVADVSPGSIATEKMLRQVGFAAWARNVAGRSSVGSGAHVHAVSLIDPGNKGQGQIAAWNRGENGLNGGKDPAGHPAWLPNLFERLGATNLSAISGVGGTGPSLSIPHFGDMKAVKAHAAALAGLGMFNIGGLNKDVLPGLMVKKYIDLAVDKYGKDAFSGGVSGAGQTTSYTGDGEKMRNAATIASEGSGMGRRAQIIGIATAIVESGLRNLSYGDRDSVGLFQQRAPWGSFSDRTNPQVSAGMFFHGGKGGQRGLDDIPNWRSMDMGKAAQAVQVSAFPSRYAKQMGAATRILDDLKVKKYARGGESIPAGWNIFGDEGPELVYTGTGAKARNTQVTMATVMKSKAAQHVTPQQAGPVTNNNSYDHSSNVSVAKANIYAADLTDFKRKLEADARRTALTTARKGTAR